MKDHKFDFDKVVTANINHFPEQYPSKAFVFWTNKNQYLQIKKYDEQRKVYLCRIKQQSADEE